MRRDKTSDHRRPTSIDLFAGCGGLSLGLHAAGFRNILAVERSDMAAETYYHNLIARIPDHEPHFWRDYCKRGGTDAGSQIAAGLFVGPIERLLEDHRTKLVRLIHARAPRGIDLIAGGPPCQGFSTAGRRDAKDARNLMPWYFLDFVRLFEPKFVLIENVAGFRMRFTRDGLGSTGSAVQTALSTAGNGYVVQMLVLNALHFGAPQNRPRTVIIGVRRDIADRIGIVGPQPQWVSDWAEELPRLPARTMAPKPISRRNAKTVRDAIGDLDGGRLPSRRHHFGTQTAVPAALENERYDATPQNQTTRRHGTRVTERFRIYQILRMNNLGTDLLAIAASCPKSVATLLRSRLEGRPDIRFPLVSPDKLLTIDSFRELAVIIQRVATRKRNQQALAYDEPAPTVMTLPDDFAHPRAARTLSVREMARLQTFPDAFVFRGKETTGGMRRRVDVPQYSQVGNAVPPILARAVAERLRTLLNALCGIPPSR